MAELIQALIRDFNIQSVQILDARPTSNPYDGKIPNIVKPDPALYQSTLGTPVLSNIEFKGGEQFTDLLTGQLKTVPPFRIDTVLLTVNQAKIMPTTQIQGRDGTVKEYIGLDDYQVEINLILNGQNGVYPTNDVLTLKKILDAPVALAVSSWYLQNFGIYNIVLKTWNAPQNQGYYSQQAFSISALSDQPAQLGLYV